MILFFFSGEDWRFVGVRYCCIGGRIGRDGAEGNCLNGAGSCLGVGRRADGEPGCRTDAATNPRTLDGVMVDADAKNVSGNDRP